MSFKLQEYVTIVIIQLKTAKESLEIALPLFRPPP